MTLFFDVVLAVHLAALALAGLASFGMPMVARALANAPPEGRAALGALRGRIANAGLMALGTLVTTGTVLLLIGVNKPLGLWFGAKLTAVFVLACVVFYARENAANAAKGDAAAQARAPKLARLSTALLLLVILLAALAFG
ncbi:MAG: hypothetical protein GC146_10810 [Limimaricola sp.]|uniref:hypothetical protein n=1 Tax=Limimaricola sp. TaxID=2211665 RepID=UPI001DDBC0BE|nr:hypothetical protein [Limimaricola sp.]MBI1417701.1 hypothetical protein [Limimaricola sp.]